MTSQESRATLADMILGLAARHGDRPALVQGARIVSYAGLARDAARLAHALRARGVAPGDQVGLCLRDGIDGMTALAALWMLDAVPVPVDFRNRADERQRLVQEFDLTCILEDRDVGGGTYPAILWDGALAEAAAAQPDHPPGTLAAGIHPAVISLTSGTTARPLGIVMGHRTLLLRALGYALESDYPMGARFLNAYPLSFSASRHHTLGHLVRGGTVLFHPPTFGAAELAHRVQAEAIDFLFAVPATVSALLDLAGEGGQPFFPGLKMLYCGGSGMSAEDKRRAHARLTPGFLHCFSSSVSGTVSVLAGADVAARADTDGRILPTVRAEIVDEADRPVAPGEVGAMRVRSHGMAEALYRGRARDTGDRIRDGWAHTGDLARISADGFLTVVGRTSDLIIRGGANVHPAEVEGAIARLPGVREVAVVGFPDPALGEEIAAFVVGDARVTEAALTAHCRLDLPPDKRPRRFVLIDALPRNANGKVLRRDLRERL